MIFWINNDFASFDSLEIMESMALHQESSYERLYRWTQSKLPLLNTQDQSSHFFIHVFDLRSGKGVGDYQ